MKLDNKVAIVTGGAMGNGLGIVKVFLKYGAKVVIFDYSDKLGETLKELNVPYIVAKSRDDVHAKLLTMIGVDKVVQPERDIGARLAKTIMHKNVIERMEVGKEYSIVEVETPKEWIGSRLNQLNIRPKYNINILCIEKENNKILIPTAEYVIQEGDNIMLIAPNKELEPTGFLGRLG